MLYAGSNLNNAEAVFVAAADPADYPVADANSGAVAGASPKRQMTGALAHQSPCRSGADLWRRRSSARAYIVRSNASAARSDFQGVS
jgi:hypothetical protein